MSFRDGCRLVLILGVLLVSLSVHHAGEIARLDRPGIYDLQSAGFVLPRQAEVRIDAQGVGIRQSSDFWSWWGVREGQDDDAMLVYAWLIDADTREPVWVMDYFGSKRDDPDRRYLRTAEERLSLEAGRYELYLFSGIDAPRRLTLREADEEQTGSWWEALFGNKNPTRQEVEEALEACYVRLEVDGLSRREISRSEVTGEIAGALHQQNRAGDSVFTATGFELTRPSVVRIYSLFEKVRGQETSADYGWIVDFQTREIVWSANEAFDEDAGGHSKNRLVDDEIELGPGRYVLYFGTDDSHSLAQYNTNPPHDPLNWGIALLPSANLDAGGFSTFPVQEPEPLIELTRVVSGAAREQAFRLDSGGRLHVLALGEYGVDDDLFYDFGWIIDGHTGETVWKMTERNTVGAGGAEKNRRFDGVIELPAGEYVLYYVSDGSHAWDEWNLAAPFEAERWGVTIRPGPGFDSRSFRELDVTELEASGGVLVRIVRVGDDERQNREFSLDRPTRVKLYGVGEGSGGAMYDYGYVVDDGGRRIWEMSWDNTRHAGGADKNRVADDEIVLEAGVYRAIYVTDDSHAYGSWNSRPPRDPIHWGLTVRRVD
jgi:hypothetical protein